MNSWTPHIMNTMFLNQKINMKTVEHESKEEDSILNTLDTLPGTKVKSLS